MSLVKDVRIRAPGDTIARATVDGKDWKTLDPTRGVFLPAAMGKANKIDVDIHYR